MPRVNRRLAPSALASDNPLQCDRSPANSSRSRLASIPSSSSNTPPSRPMHRFDPYQLPDYIHEQDIDGLDCSICSLEEHMDDPFIKHRPGAPDFGAQALISLVIGCFAERDQYRSGWPEIDRRMCTLVRDWCRQRDTSRNIQTMTPCRFCYRMHVEGHRYNYVMAGCAVPSGESSDGAEGWQGGRLNSGPIEESKQTSR